MDVTGRHVTAVLARSIATCSSDFGLASLIRFSVCTGVLGVSVASDRVLIAGCESSDRVFKAGCESSDRVFIASLAGTEEDGEAGNCNAAASGDTFRRTVALAPPACNMKSPAQPFAARSEQVNSSLPKMSSSRSFPLATTVKRSTSPMRRSTAALKFQTGSPDCVITGDATLLLGLPGKSQTHYVFGFRPTETVELSRHLALAMKTLKFCGA